MRIIKWIGIVLFSLVCVAFAVRGYFIWQHQREAAAFSKLPPGARQLAIFDAYAAQIERNYFDREFIDKKWPAQRDEWRRKAAANARDDAYLYDQIFVQLSQRVPSSHVGAIAPQALVDQEARKNASSAQPVSPGESGFTYAMARRSNGFILVVNDVRQGSPAEKAGIEPGWSIISLDGCHDGQTRSAKFNTWGTPAQRLEAETGKPTAIGDPEIKTDADFVAKYRHDFSYTCGPVSKQPPFETRLIGNGVRYIRFDTFVGTEVMDQVLAALDQATAAGAIIDLRNNAGGDVSEEVRLIARLLPEKTRVGTRRSRAGDEEQLAGAGAKYAGPLAILMGPSTASAGEVVAAALQDNHRATLLGRGTAGATLTSGRFPLPDGGSVQVGYQDFLRANGQRIEGAGVTPDIAIMPTLTGIRAGHDATLERALDALAHPQLTSAR